MTKVFCDVCGKELSAVKRYEAYTITFSRPFSLTREYSQVCPDCAEKIRDFILHIKG